MIYAFIPGSLLPKPVRCTVPDCPRTASTRRDVAPYPPSFGQAPVSMALCAEHAAELDREDRELANGAQS